MRFGPFRFHPGNGLWRGVDEVPLPPRALALLTSLVARAGTVVSKQALMDAVWKEAFVTEASLLEAVRVLREALGDDRQNPRYIQTLHGRGYRFMVQPERDAGHDGAGGHLSDGSGSDGHDADGHAAERH